MSDTDVVDESVLKGINQTRTRVSANQSQKLWLTIQRDGGQASQVQPAEAAVAADQSKVTPNHLAILTLKSINPNGP